MKNLTEKEAEIFLEKRGFSVAKRVLIKKESEINYASKKIKFPWAMKASSKDINHKAKIGAVVLNVISIQKAHESFLSLSKVPGFKEVMIQPMIEGYELILGIKQTDEFGNVIMFGKGGSHVEKEKDISFRVPPLSDYDLNALILDTKIGKEISKKINLKKLKIQIKKLSLLAQKDKIKELDINPLIVNNNFALVVDARLSKKK